MLKILLIQEKSRHAINNDFRECCCLKRAFESLNQSVMIWGLGWNNFSALPDFNSYDLIITMENYGDNWLPDLSTIKNPMKMLWTIDSHTRGLDVYIKIFNAGNYDVLLQSTKEFVPLDPNKKSIWFPNSYDDSLFKYADWNKKKYFIGFCGSLLNRRPYLKKLQEWFGNEYKENIFVLGSDMISAIQSYKINFNLNIANDINFRSFETLGAGSVLCTNFNSQYPDLGFQDGVNCIFFNHNSNILTGIVNRTFGFKPRLFSDLADSVNNRFSGNFTRLQDRLLHYYTHEDELKSLAKNSIVLSRAHTYTERARLLMKNVETGKLQGFDSSMVGKT
jgi:hypothetical protein